MASQGSAPPARKKWGILVAVLVCAMAGAGGYLAWQKENQRPLAETKPIPMTPSNAPVAPRPAPAPSATPVAPVAAPAPQPEALTNDFAIMPFKLEKTPGSSLVYVTGTIRNTSGRQRFGIKVEFGLFDTNDTRIGSATDYQSELDPHAEWRFKALAMASRTVSARFHSIAEDQ
jgi:hypothetical protein